jgi:16S rRNA A1518/A1519 N6-dimethyltransferase RsmA/KsgA/DIM1 with predicted DNA glycosylase/AP lyase activity
MKEKWRQYMMPCIKPSLITTKSMLSTMPIQENNCKTILEIGSGTGNLKRFKENQQDYTGLEYSQSMIAIAKKEMKLHFHLGICGISILRNKWMPLLSRVVPRVT